MSLLPTTGQRLSHAVRAFTKSHVRQMLNAEVNQDHGRHQAKVTSKVMAMYADKLLTMPFEKSTMKKFPPSGHVLALCDNPADSLINLAQALRRTCEGHVVLSDSSVPGLDFSEALCLLWDPTWESRDAKSVRAAARQRKAQIEAHIGKRQMA